MELLTVQETARLLKVTPMTVRRYIAAGRLPAVKVGKGVRVHMTNVEALLTPVAPITQEGATLVTLREKGERETMAERISIRSLTVEEQERARRAIGEARHARARMLAERDACGSLPMRLFISPKAPRQ